MAERTKCSEVALVLQVVTTHRRAVFTAFTGEQEDRSHPLYMWAKRVVGRGSPTLLLMAFGSRSRFRINGGLPEAHHYTRGVTTIVLLKPSYWCCTAPFGINSPV